MYKLFIAKKVQKFIASRSPKEQVRILKKFELLQKDPYTRELDIKPFHSKMQHCYRLRIGHNRFIYEIEDDKLLITMFDGNTRGDIY